MGINTSATSSRSSSIIKEAPPSTGPKASPTKIPANEYQPKPEAIASAW
ncbi:Uncharacterised protein [Vibrio cholerae]|uniref:Uncharacterized protein n=1 Tax=Vibrio cholerae TaxID=666 RepID=A0A655RRV0_VIBCL|nr:Uncharacterised protein [Vibrio cholerae]